jgi:alpha-1,6-mannosyltransferase
MDKLLDALLVIVPWIYVFLAPYTKVEESFNLHATHDVIMYGVGPGGLEHVRPSNHISANRLPTSLV